MNEGKLEGDSIITLLKQFTILSALPPQRTLARSNSLQSFGTKATKSCVFLPPTTHLSLQHVGNHRRASDVGNGTRRYGPCRKRTYSFSTWTLFLSATNISQLLHYPSSQTGPGS